MKFLNKLEECIDYLTLSPDMIVFFSYKHEILKKISIEEYFCDNKPIIKEINKNCFKLDD